jgi:AraC-like DNA-binding protein
MTRAAVFEPGVPVRTVAVRFRPGGAVPFLRVAAAELTDRVVDGAALGISWLDAGRPGDGADPMAAAGWLERRLLDRLPAAAAPDPLVAYAVTSLFGPRPPSIEALSHKVGWSRQHLTRAFRSHVGVGPKLLARVARLQRAMVDLQALGARRGRGAGLADAAFSPGVLRSAAHGARISRAWGRDPRGGGGLAGGRFHFSNPFAAGRRITDA